MSQPDLMANHVILKIMGPCNIRMICHLIVITDRLWAGHSRSFYKGEYKSYIYIYYLTYLIIVFNMYFWLL